jgi:subtilisin family serine protease
MRASLRGLRVGGLVLALMVGLGTPTASAEGAAAAGAGDPAWAIGDGLGRTVTLITGDRVSVGPERQIRVEPAAGRETVRFARRLEGGDVYVVPADAVPPLVAKTLDRRLFNVTKLLEFGYDDRSRSDVPLIVEYADGPARSLAPGVLSAGGTDVKRALPSFGGAAVTTPKRGASEFWAGVRGSGRSAAGPATGRLVTGIERVWLDGPVRASLDRSVPQVGAPQAWQAGLTGKGATVAVLDSGIDATHPDLVDAVIQEQDFTGGPSGPTDRFGHGTHVASIITGSGAASDGTYVGVAPDATLMNGKVLDDFGNGWESWIIEGMEWAATQGADVVNMSLGVAVFTDDVPPVSRALDELTERTGTLFVVAAGNSGPDERSIGAPGTADTALTVGAVDRTDGLADFSSRGPRRGDEAIKPDITAPGVGIVAARAKDALLGTPGEAYMSLSGTSMATPHVSGAAAILAAEHPEWTPERLKSLLVGSAAPNDGLTVYQQGGGRLDVARAVRAEISASPASASLGVARWPHDDDAPIATTMTYRNGGSTAVTLDLRLDVRGGAGQAAPAAMFTVAPDRVTVPAGGSAVVTLTADTSVPAADGRYGGFLVATGDGGQVAVRTPVGVTREVESYDLTVEHTDRAGAAPEFYFSRLVSIDHEQAYPAYHPSGTVTVRLPKGHYYFDAWMFEPGFSESTAIIEPDIRLTADVHIAADAREGRPVDLHVDRTEADEGRAAVYFLRKTAWGDTGLLLDQPTFKGLYVRPSETAAPSGEFTFLLDADLARPDGDGGFVGSPYFYRVRSTTDGRVPDELEPRLRDRDLVKVTSVHAASAPGEVGLREHMVSAVLPFTLTEYYSPGIPVVGAFALLGEGGPTYGEDRAVKVYEGAKPRTERWNAAVFGPAFPYDVVPPVELAGRTGDTVKIILPMFTDQGSDHAGYSRVDSASTTLYRDGVRVGESPALLGTFQVPGGAANYRLEAAATRSNSDLSTRVAATWSFRSDTVVGDARPLPLLAVRYAPTLDDHNRAAGGRAFTVPVYVQRNGAATAPDLTEFTVRASYDDGATWRPVRLIASGDQWLAVLSHPADARFVSLRATATDSAGNSVDQTIIRAYGLK